ncbi:GNAT family N-acetyltransferase [Pontibacter actiniarum]|uniref:GNAT family N-acetyltransferase n=1 Tax=Pontibacter actiniarum TaxID=323450 RepID=A0A1X9YN70_9BACT|nr:GNAT family protein [Pontibacter actiniarum]ARS34330.1 GNAT family N-acetyltransferase [Pontibacter actiniarum]
MKDTHALLQLQVGPDLYLRRATVEDAPDLFQIIDRDRHYLRQWLPFIDFSQQLADTESYLKFISAPGNRTDLVFVIVHEEEVCGLIGFKDIDNLNKKLEIGYWLAEGRQGHGIMRRACHTLLQYAFEKLHMNRIEIRVGVGNSRSSNIPKKLGFTLEGIKRQGEYLNGRFHDLEVYSLLRGEFGG